MRLGQVTNNAALPSQQAAENFLRGEPGSVSPIIGSMALRGGLIGIGLFTAGIRGRHLVVGALSAAASIELFVLAWTGLHMWNERRKNGQATKIAP